MEDQNNSELPFNIKLLSSGGGMKIDMQANLNNENLILIWNLDFKYNFLK